MNNSHISNNSKKLETLLDSDPKDFILLRSLAHSLKAGELQDVIWLTQDFMYTENQKNAFNIVNSIYEYKRSNP